MPACRYVVDFGEVGDEPTVGIESAPAEGMIVVPAGVLMHYYMEVAELDCMGDENSPLAQFVYIDVVVEGNKHAVSVSISPGTFINGVGLFYVGTLLSEFLLEEWTDRLDEEDTVGPLDTPRGWQAPREDIEA
jgi:hypothetical protein